MTKKKGKPRERPSILYKKYNPGTWTRSEWQLQCPQDLLFGRCQGVKGHEGNHWCYDNSGWFCWEVPGKLRKFDIRAGQTPPGHKEYKTPESMLRHHYRCFSTMTTVTDKRVLDLLNRGKTPEKHASVDEPLSLEEEQDLMNRGELP